jgi:mono/diheme cytochrome c family protein
VKLLFASLGFIAICGSFALLSGAPASSEGAKSGAGFTAAQAAKGQATYYAKCAMCHGANLEGISGPALKGKDANLQEQTVSGVYAYTTTEMPVGNAGGLPSADYVNILAFLLQSNGRHAGAKALTVAALKADTTKIGGPK